MPLKYGHCIFVARTNARLDFTDPAIPVVQISVLSVFSFIYFTDCISIVMSLTNSCEFIHVGDHFFLRFHMNSRLHFQVFLYSITTHNFEACTIVGYSIRGFGSGG